MQRIANLGYYAGGWLSDFVRAISSLPAFHILRPLNQIEWYVAWQYMKNLQVELLWLRRVAQSKSAMGRQKLDFLCLLKSPPTPTTTTGTPSHFQWTSRLSENHFADVNYEGYLKVLSRSWAFQNCDLDAKHHSELCREDGSSLEAWGHGKSWETCRFLEKVQAVQTRTKVRVKWRLIWEVMWEE